MSAWLFGNKPARRCDAGGTLRPRHASAELRCCSGRKDRRPRMSRMGCCPMAARRRVGHRAACGRSSGMAGGSERCSIRAAWSAGSGPRRPPARGPVCPAALVANEG